MAIRGFLVCADITGYTAYLSGTELEHASGILTELLRLLLGEVQAPLQLSRVEGDAVISYAPPGDGFQGQMVVDRLDDTYVAFRRALQQMIVNTSCPCQACATIDSLDLKFLIHHGEFAVQRIGQQDELVGPDVNFLFRLTKNKIRATLGLPGYMAFTGEALAALALPGFADILAPHREDDPERGSVVLHVRNMGPIWEDRRNRAAFEIPREDILIEGEYTLPVPIDQAWSYLTRPESRAVMFGADAMDVDRLADGRIGPNAVYVCSHGSQKIPHTVVDWLPPRRYAYSSPVPGGMSMVGQFRLEPESETSTKIGYLMSISRGLKSTLFRSKIRKQMQQWTDQGLARLADMVEAGRTE